MKETDFKWKIKVMRDANWTDYKIHWFFIDCLGLTETEFKNHIKTEGEIKKPKEYLQKRKECYFCKEKDVMEHHMSYKPERVIYLCRACHNKLHFVIDKYHKYIKEQMISKNNEKVI